MSDKTLEDRNSTDMITAESPRQVLGTRIKPRPTQPQCLGLKTSLERSKRLRIDGDIEREALCPQAKRAKSEPIGGRAKLILELHCMKLDHKEDPTALKIRRDRAIAALPMSLRRIGSAEDEVRSTACRTVSANPPAKTRPKERATQLDQPEAVYLELAAPKPQDSEAHGEKPGKVIDQGAQTLLGLQSRSNKWISVPDCGAEGVLKAQEAFQKDTERGSWENTRDQASQDLQIEASVVAASQARIEEPERLLEAKDAAHKDLDTIAWTNADRATREQHLAESKDQQGKSQDLLRVKDAELERNAQHLEERGSQRIQIKATDKDGGAPSVRSSTTRKQPPKSCNGLSRRVKATGPNQGAVCSLVRNTISTVSNVWVANGRLVLPAKTIRAIIWLCERRFLANSNEILELRRTVSSLTAKLDNQKRKMSSLTAESQKACCKANTAVKATNDLFGAKEEALDEEVGRQKAEEMARATARKRFQSRSPLPAEVVELRKALQGAEGKTKRKGYE
ncbi:hypothetical protein MMC22_005971 [Lobaria immixta]|nr:hypothetical protein [Lobaria immixta]